MKNRDQNRTDNSQSVGPNTSNGDEENTQPGAPKPDQPDKPVGGM